MRRLPKKTDTVYYDQNQAVDVDYHVQSLGLHNIPTTIKALDSLGLMDKKDAQGNTLLEQAIKKRDSHLVYQIFNITPHIIQNQSNTSTVTNFFNQFIHAPMTTEEYSISQSLISGTQGSVLSELTTPQIGGIIASTPCLISLILNPENLPHLTKFSQTLSVDIAYQLFLSPSNHPRNDLWKNLFNIDPQLFKKMNQQGDSILMKAMKDSNLTSLDKKNLLNAVLSYDSGSVYTKENSQAVFDYFINDHNPVLDRDFKELATKTNYSMLPHLTNTQFNSLLKKDSLTLFLISDNIFNNLTLETTKVSVDTLFHIMTNIVSSSDIWKTVCMRDPEVFSRVDSNGIPLLRKISENPSYFSNFRELLTLIIEEKPESLSENNLPTHLLNIIANLDSNYELRQAVKDSFENLWNVTKGALETALTPELLDGIRENSFTIWEFLMKNIADSPMKQAQVSQYNQEKQRRDARQTLDAMKGCTTS